MDNITLPRIHQIQFRSGSKEELLPNFTSTFPYIASQTELDHWLGHFVPWHWHKSVELFYMQSGVLEYCTPGRKYIFPAGSAGFVNSNVLHSTRRIQSSEKNVQLLHIFDPAFLAGETGSRIEAAYITPLISASNLDILPFWPENAEHRPIIDCILSAFSLSPDEFGYELKLRSLLSDLWLEILRQAQPMLCAPPANHSDSEPLKQMLVYIYEHYPEKISVAQLAAAAHLSERECFRVFHECLHTTPIEYITRYRLQIACQLLAREAYSVTDISHRCGFGRSSYFGKLFYLSENCTPLEYRRKWQDRNKNRP